MGNSPVVNTMNSTSSYTGHKVILVGLVTLTCFACSGAQSTSESSSQPEEALPSNCGGTIRVAIRETGDSLDGRTGTWIQSELVSTIFEKLVTVNREGEVKPGLAESWQTSDGGKRVTFHLRQGVKFHDGTNFNSAAVKKWVLGYKDGPSEYLFSPVVDVKTPDTDTVIFVLKSPFPNLFHNLSSYFSGVHSPTATENNGEQYGQEYAVGTGPYKLDEFVQRNKLVVERNPDYSWAPSWMRHPGPACPDQIIFQTEPDTEAWISAVTSGRAHVGVGAPPLFVDDFKSNYPDLNIHSFKRKGPSFSASI